MMFETIIRNLARDSLDTQKRSSERTISAALLHLVRNVPSRESNSSMATRIVALEKALRSIEKGSSDQISRVIATEALGE